MLKLFVPRASLRCARATGVRKGYFLCLPGFSLREVLAEAQTYHVDPSAPRSGVPGYYQPPLAGLTSPHPTMRVAAT